MSERLPAGSGSEPAAPAHPQLKRGLSLPLLTLYGLGTTLGAGIYVLIGEVAGVAGMLAPISFIVASLLAAASAFSFAELSARYPQSAGEAIYVYNGLGSRGLALAVGLLVILAGTVSSAAIVNGFVGYLHEFVDVPGWLAITLLVLAFGAIAAWGIVESVTAAALFTLLEMAGLALVIWVARDSFADLPTRGAELIPAWGAAAPIAILSGAVLAFYAFIGFEDMVNVAEEVKQVSRNLPRAIILTLVVTTVFYLALSLAAVLTVPPDELQASKAPLALVYERSTGGAATIITLIGLVAIVNGALIQIVMGSRVLYGLANRGWLPARLGRVNRRTKTPLFATALVTGSVLIFALWLPLVTLAQATSLVALIIFALVNLALFRVKLRHEPAPAGAMQTPFWLPPVGFVFSAGFAAYQAAAFIRG
jgi:amino acid transporter